MKLNAEEAYLVELDQEIAPLPGQIERLDGGRIDRDVPKYSYRVIWPEHEQARYYLAFDRIVEKLVRNGFGVSVAKSVAESFGDSVLTMAEREEHLVVESACAVFNALNAPPLSLPDEAPEIYKGNRGGRATGENIEQFLRRVWLPWIEAGVLTRPDLRRLDPQADQGITNWLRTKAWPADLVIPSKSATIDSAVDDVGGIAAARRLGVAAYRRASRTRA